MQTKSVVLKKFKQLMSLKYSNRTIENYSYYVSKFLEFANNTPDRVTNDDFLNYNIYLVKKQVSNSTRNVAINAIKTYFKIYLKKKLKKNIAIRPKFKKQVVRHIEHHYLTQKLDNIKNLKAKLILTLGYACGLRSNEVIELKRKDVNLKEKFIIINGKGSRQRKLPISDYLVNLILEYGYKHQPKIYLFNGLTNTNKFKQQYSSSSVLALVKKNIGNYRFHDLRHSFGMRLYQQGVPLDQIRKLMGHKKTETTEIYAYASDTILMRVEMPL